MTLSRRLTRLADHWPPPEEVLASGLAEALRAVSPRTIAHSEALYRTCRSLMAAADLSEPATARALTRALIAVGFPEDGVRQCMGDMPGYYTLAIACLGETQVDVWRTASEVERQRLNEYLDSLFSEAERKQLDDLAQRLMMMEQG